MMARRPHKPTVESRAAVKALVAFGIPEADIAKYQRIDPATLSKHYREELDSGLIEAAAKVAQRLYQRAVKDGDLTAIIWWEKTRRGMRDLSKVELTGPNGGPILQLCLSAQLTEADIREVVRCRSLPVAEQLREARALVEHLEESIRSSR